MRVLLVTDFFDPYNGGVEIHVRTVADALVARGHEVAVATMDTGPDQPARTGDDPVTVFPVNHLIARLGKGFTNANRPWAPPFPDPMAMAGLRRAIKSFRPDVIHGHDWLSRSALPRLVSGSVPIVTSLHYYTRSCAKKTLWRDGGRCQGPALTRCLRCAGDHYGTAKGTVVTLGLRAGAALEDRRSASYISVSEATATGNGLPAGPPSAEPVGSAGSVVVANPLAPDAAAGNAAGAATVPASIPDGPFIAFVGDLRPEKGIRILLAAVELLRRQGSDVPVVLVGERTTADLDVPDGTIETGQVDHEVVQAIWRRATVGVVPSLWPEPFGLVAIEAMAAGCPLVASDVGGLSEILADDRGVLVPPGDAAALADAVARLLGDNERRAELTAKAKASLDRYDLDHIVDGIEVQYRTAIDGRG